MGEVSVGSFPRSGNHFLVKVLRILFPELKVNWFEHNISWLSTKPNVITIARNPVDCVSSWINFTQDIRTNRAEKVLEWYCAYSSKCIELKNNICILNFDELIFNIESTINKICSIYDIKEIPDFNLLPTFDSEFCNRVSFTYDKTLLNDEVMNSNYFNEAFSLYGEMLDLSEQGRLKPVIYQ
jgi:hypothetical protein